MEQLLLDLPDVRRKLTYVTDENKDRIISGLHELVDECQAIIRRINRPEDYRDETPLA